MNLVGKENIDATKRPLFRNLDFIIFCREPKKTTCVVSISPPHGERQIFQKLSVGWFWSGTTLLYSLYSITSSLGRIPKHKWFLFEDWGVVFFEENRLARTAILFSILLMSNFPRFMFSSFSFVEEVFSVFIGMVEAGRWLLSGWLFRLFIW